MREIKFRAWDKKIGEYHYSVNDFLGFWEVIIPRNLEPEQYTGLKDKNGREIYEGDIVKIVTENGFLNHWMAIGEKYVVEYEKYGFSPFTEYDSDCCQYLVPEWCEVIGNIHENPEFLKY